MMETNYRYSVELYEYCVAKRVPLIYASSAAVYGASTVFKESDADAERPLNVYGYSKLLFDNYVRRREARGPRSEGEEGARPWSACATSTSTGPAKRTKARWRAWRFTCTGKSPRRGTRVCSKAAAALRPASSGATSCTSATSST